MPAHYQSGTHVAEIIGQEFAETEYGVQLAIKIMPQNGEYERTVFLGLTNADGVPASFVNDAGETVNVADQSLEIIAYLGLPDQRISRLDPKHPEFFSFEGLQVTAYCQHKMRKDGTIGERWYINVPRALGRPVENNALRKLDSLFGKALKAKLKEKGKPAAAEEAVPAEGVAEPAEEPDALVGVSRSQTATANKVAGEDDVPF